MDNHPVSDRRQRILHIEAVVLKHSDWGEADRMLWLFSQEQGKIKALAKGVRKIRSRKAGHLEPITRAKIQLAKGRDILLITQADALDAFLPLREDLAGLTYASYIIELLDRFTYEEGENWGLYRLLVETLERLASGEDRELVIRFFEIRLLDLVGFRPQLFRCLGCGEEITAQDQYFSALEGGIICPSCARRGGTELESGYQPITTEALKYLRHFQRSNFADARKARLNREINREIEVIMQYYLTYLLERGLNTPTFLRRVRRDQIDKDSAGEAI